jgi:hypothetical protein
MYFYGIGSSPIQKYVISEVNIEAKRKKIGKNLAVIDYN